MNKPALDELFEYRVSYPDFEPQERLARLVGLDDQKIRLTKVLGLLVNSSSLHPATRYRSCRRPGWRCG